ncbi:hypothetical protein ACSBR2_031638 [Camellia fascicularis]
MGVESSYEIEKGWDYIHEIHVQNLIFLAWLISFQRTLPWKLRLELPNARFMVSNWKIGIRDCLGVRPFGQAT